MSVDPVVPISAIEHFVYCPRQCALIHCDGVWSDNAHTVRGSRAHRRVDSGRHRRERGRQVLRAIPLWSEVLGLSGRADAVEIEGAAVRPVEYKSGTRHGDAADLQLCAQALCLEEMLEVEIPHGYVWYGGPRRRVQVDFALELRRGVRDVIRRIRAQLLRFELPEAPNDERCTQCQLLHHCLPGLTSAPRKVKRYLAHSVFECVCRARCTCGTIAPGCSTAGGRCSCPRSFVHMPGGGVYLSDDGRMRLIKEWEAHKEADIHHQVLGRPIGRWALPSVQATLLARHLRGDLPAYPPFVLP